ncbi:MAG TPA: glycosyltransferase family 4 protein [Bacteroidales bacterium]|nr:glycosyltransferase family 4 protein [Bacteroidales bacterium]
MKILILCNKSPYPPKEGGPIAMNAIIEGLAGAGHQVKVLAVNSEKFAVDINSIPDDYRIMTNIETVFIDLSIKPLDALMNLFSGKSYHVERFISTNFKKKLIEILTRENFDIVQLETLYMSPYVETIRKYSAARILLRSHNIEHLIWERVAAVTTNPLKKLYLKHLAKTLKNYELGVLDKFDGIVTITNKDGEYFRQIGCKTPVLAVPFGINLDKFKENPGIETEFPSLFSIGAMNWIPNEEGVKWFLDKVWPKLNQTFPELKYYIAGRAMPDWLLKADLPNVVVVGEVEDAFDFMYSKAVEIVPLFSGSGIRIKIIEGMAAGRAIVSTTIGAEGIHVSHGENILLADNPNDFYDAVCKCVQNRELTRKLGENARKLVFAEHSNKELMLRLVDFYMLLNKSH